VPDPYTRYARNCEVLRRCQEEYDNRHPDDIPDGCHEDDYEPDDDWDDGYDGVIGEG